MTENLKARLEVDVSNFTAGMKKAREDLEKANDQVEEARSEWSSLGDVIGELVPGFKKVTDSWKDAQSKLDSGSKKAGKGFKAMKAAGVLAVAAIAVEVAGTLVDAFKQVAQVADDTARMFDTVAYSKAAGELKKSTRTLKTTIGSFTAPVVNALKSGLAKILDGFNWLLTKIRIAFSYISGVFTAVIQPIVKAIKSAIDWLKNGINTIAGFLGMDAIFKEASKNTEDAAGSMEELVEATSAGLASFDKLNTLDFGEMGDAEQSEELTENMEQARKDGLELGEKLTEKFAGIGKWFDNLDLGQVWRDFKISAEDAWINIKTWAGDTWNSIKGWGEGVWNSLKESAGKIWDGLTGAWEGVKTTLLGYFNKLIEIVDLGKIWDSLKNGFDRIMNWIKENLPDWAKKILSWVGVDFGESTTTPEDDGNDEGNDNNQEPPKKNSSTIVTPQNTIKDVSSTIVDVTDKIDDAIVEPIIGVDPSKENPNVTVPTNNKGLSGFVNNLKDELKNPGKNSFWSNLFWGAEGGVFQPNNHMIIGVGDNRKEPEVLSPISTLKQAVREVIAESGSSSNSPIQINLVVDGKTLARTLYNPIEDERRRRGVKA